jgi:hypothetical protein
MDFIEKLDNMYKSHLIYRTIVVCDRDICEYKRLLENKDFSVYIVNSIGAGINYDTLDYRVILIESAQMDEFLSDIFASNHTGFFTYITFTNDDDTVKDMITKKYDIRNAIV